VAAHAEDCGLQPVIAHPERADEVLARPERVEELAEQGWLLQVNGSSLLGRHGLATQELAWELVERGLASLVGSDGHRQARPARLDEAYALVRARVGEAARALFDGSALGVAATAVAA
jgi:protein-tyrosine phosphatase